MISPFGAELIGRAFCQADGFLDKISMLLWDKNTWIFSKPFSNDKNTISVRI